MAAPRTKRTPSASEMAIPMVEPRLGGRTVEHPVGLVVAAIHLQLKLKIGGEVRAGIPPARVERGQHAGHFEQEACRSAGEYENRGILRRVVESDEEVVGRQVLQFTSHGAGGW